MIEMFYIFNVLWFPDIITIINHQMIYFKWMPHITRKQHLNKVDLKKIYKSGKAKEPRIKLVQRVLGCRGLMHGLGIKVFQVWRLRKR